MYNNRRSSYGGQNRNNQSNGSRNFNRYGSNSGQRKRNFGENIPTHLFIKKAKPIIKIEEIAVKNNFEDFGFNKTLLKNIKDKGYIKPTKIQDEAIPEIMTGRDVLGIANTGTGKTAAFALPIIDQITKNPSKRFIILAPTRELAQQIKQEIRSFTFDLRVYVTLAIGGSNIREQIRDISRDPHVIVGTPGRIKDLGDRRIINFSRMNVLVLDEVDRMLDMGFIGDIRYIVDQIPNNRQTLFFSATMGRKVESLIDTFLYDPIKISIESQKSSDNVDQDIVMVNRHNKEEILINILGKEEVKKVLVFGATQRIVEKISNNLIDTGFRAGSLHGGKPQNKRQRILKMFKNNDIDVLIATDVAARGLDVSDISHVINYDKPNNYEDYIHRIGRTGRANAKGYALTFVENRY